MDVTLALSAAIFTLLAIVVATSLLKASSSPAADFASARSYFGQRAAGLEPAAAAKQNGHARAERKEEADIWSEISGSSHDHWDVVKSVLSVSVPQADRFTHALRCACLFSSLRCCVILPLIRGSRPSLPLRRVKTQMMME